MCRNIRAALPRALNTITDEAGVSCQYFHLGAVVLNNKWHSWTFFYLSRTHRHTRHRSCQHAQTSRSSSSGEKFPVDILCFSHNIDFRGKAAGGLLVNFHITLEEDAKLFTCTNRRGAVRGEWLDGQIKNMTAVYWKFLPTFNFILYHTHK